jgi:predicted dienelactone hydrolase
MSRPAGLLLACACLFVLSSTVPAAARAGDDAVVPGPRDTYGVGSRVLDLEDGSRTTPADPDAQHGVIEAADTRALPTTIYYPTDPTGSPEAVADAEPADGRFPVILFSHGAPGTPIDYHRVLERWASEGFFVVAPQFPISSTAGPTDVAWQDSRDQIRDAAYVLTQVLRRNPDSWRKGGFGGRLDTARISAVGHSMGGYTTLGLVSDCCRDGRIKAALVLAGVSESAEGPAIEEPSAPIMFVHATLDIAVPFRNSERAYADAGDPRYLVEIRVPLGGVVAHLLPIAESFGSITRGVHRSEDAFLAAYGAGDDDALGRIAPSGRDDDLRLKSET